MASHFCRDGKESINKTWWEHDNKGIPLCKVCSDCRELKLSKYRPEILPGYEEPKWYTAWKASDDYDYSDIYDY